MRLLPIGIQEFADIRTRGFVYVDKTAQIHQLISGSGKPFFLSRPRRFGKSLLCSTLSAIFEGKRELFGEIAGRPALAIDSLEWGWEKYPVIELDLNPGNYPSDGIAELHVNLDRNMEFCAEKYDVPLIGESITDKFARLIHALHKSCGQQVVVIIDEYDKPLVNTLTEPDIHKKIRDELKSFYGVLKSYDKYLRFVFLTGITKFSRVSVFSDLNHLDDITLEPEYADICGITQTELEQAFKTEIDEILTKTGRERAKYLDDLRRFYNGYRFTEKPLTVYNPFGLLNHFKKNGKFSPYWYETATPSFLVDLTVNQKIDLSNLGELNLTEQDFSKYEIENIKAVPMLYQTGYLTITDYNDELQMYKLNFPNDEVSASFSASLLEQYTQSAAGELNKKLIEALLKGDIEGTIEILRSFFSAIPYDIIKETENYYQTAVHLIFSMLGFTCRSEVRIADGRIDTLVETRNFVYCFEFKVDKTADEALSQIDTKDYLLPWKQSGKKLFKAGVNFDSEKRNIGEWTYEAIET